MSSLPFPQKGAPQLDGQFDADDTETRDASRVFQIPIDAIHRSVSTAADVGLILQDMKGLILWANAAYGRMVGYQTHDLVGVHPLALAHPDGGGMSAQEIAQFTFEGVQSCKSWVRTFRSIRSDGASFWMETDTKLDHIADYGPVAVTVARDVTDHMTQQQKLKHISSDLRKTTTTDGLTGLANRHGILRKVASAMRHTQYATGHLGLMSIDLDRFKSINDHFGQSVGDAVLRHVADCLRRDLPPHCSAARIGGDEFVVLVPHLPSPSAIAELAQILIDRVGQPTGCAGRRITPSLCIGAAIAPDGKMGAEDLLTRAGFALGNAKENGRGCFAIYDEQLHVQKQAQDQLARDLIKAVADDKLDFSFQPLWRLGDDTLLGFETLIRWVNPRLGPVSPGAFLALAQQLGLMAQIDMAAMQAALRLKTRLRDEGFGNVRASINASAALLGQEDFFEVFMETLRAHGHKPESFTVEVLETVVLEDTTNSETVVTLVQKLFDAGVTVMLDDFGTGHAGLTHLAKLAISGVKIDRSLTEHVLTDQTCAKIIAMMHDLCKDIGLDVVTEGVETDEQIAAIRALGGDLVQGYLFAKAMPEDDVITWLHAREVPRHPN